MTERRPLGVVIFTDEQQILDEALLLRDTLRRIPVSPYLWKRALLALHDLLYGLAVSQLIGAADSDESIAYGRDQNGAPTDWLLSFDQLLREWCSQRRMAKRLGWSDENGYEIDDPRNDGSWEESVPFLWIEQHRIQAIRQLIRKQRHRFIHFKGYERLDIRRLPDLALQCLDAGDSFRYNSSEPYWHKGLRPLMTECRVLLIELRDEYAVANLDPCTHEDWWGCGKCGAMQCRSCWARVQHPATRELLGETASCMNCDRHEAAAQRQ